MTKNAGRWFVLTALYAVLFSIGSALFAPRGLPPLSEQEQSLALFGILGMSAIDAALILLFVRRSRLHGPSLVAVLAGVFYFVKTLTSQIEAVFFMPNVGASMIPSLLLMTVPLTLALPPLAVWIGGRWSRPPMDRPAAFEPLAWPRGQLALRITLLSAFVYPALFLLAGWFIAFRSPELRAFYGGAGGGTFFSHLASLEPSVYLLEALRGALWVGAALIMLHALPGPNWAATLTVAAWFALLQNDVHLIPNPLMSGTIRLYHFVETASSNAVFVGLIGVAFVSTRPSTSSRSL